MYGGFTLKIIVFGATGKTGQHVCRHALEAGHDITAFTRSPGKLDGDSRASLHTAQGDVTDAAAVAEAVAGHEAVIVALGSNGLRDVTTLSAGTKNVVDGMTQHGVEHLVVLSAAGVGDSWGQLTLLPRVMFRTLLRTIYADHTAQEAVVRGSALDWTIVRAAILKDAEATGSFTASNTAKVKDITRADLAQFLVGQVTDRAYRKQAISVTG